MLPLLTKNQHKFDKTSSNTTVTVIGLQLNPEITIFDDGRRLNLCPYAGECATACLDKAGNNATPAAAKARQRRTELYYYDFPEFKEQLTKELMHYCIDEGKDGWVRLNTLSDPRWEDKLGFDWFAKWEGMLGGFYDYTKWPIGKRHTLPPNYHLTYSWSERTTMQEFENNLECGRNVAVTMAACQNDYRGDCRHGCHCPLPDSFKGVPVLDGDIHDARFLDPTGHVVGLRLKRPNGGKIGVRELIADAVQAKADGRNSFIQIPD
jgi:hypothetical protein